MASELEQASKEVSGSTDGESESVSMENEESGERVISLDTIEKIEPAPELAMGIEIGPEMIGSQPLLESFERIVLQDVDSRQRLLMVVVGFLAVIALMFLFGTHF
jgi:hypothetical protein